MNGLENIPSFSESLTLAITVILGFGVNYLKNYLAEKQKEAEVKKNKLAHEMNVKKDEGTIANAIDYVKDAFVAESQVNPELTKTELAVRYVSIVEPETYERLGKDRLELMIKRKYYQKKQLTTPSA